MAPRIKYISREMVVEEPRFKRSAQVHLSHPLFARLTCLRSRITEDFEQKRLQARLHLDANNLLPLGLARGLCIRRKIHIQTGDQLVELCAGCLPDQGIDNIVAALAAGLLCCHSRRIGPATRVDLAQVQEQGFFGLALTTYENRPANWASASRATRASPGR